MEKQIKKELYEALEEVDRLCFIISKLDEFLDREIAICKCNKQVMETRPDMTFSNEWWYRIKIYDEIKDKLNEYKKESLKYEQEQREKETK